MEVNNWKWKINLSPIAEAFWLETHFFRFFFLPEMTQKMWVWKVLFIIQNHFHCGAFNGFFVSLAGRYLELRAICFPSSICPKWKFLFYAQWQDWSRFWGWIGCPTKKIYTMSPNVFMEWKRKCSNVNSFTNIFLIIPMAFPYYIYVCS